MADQQSGTGAKGNSQNKPRGQGHSESGNHTKTATDNRSQQIKNTNKSKHRNDRGQSSDSRGSV